MSRQTFVFRGGALVDRASAPPHPLAGRILGRAPSVRTDGMDPVRSMVSGKTFDSRSAYYAEVRRAGCEIVGDDRGGFTPRGGYEPSGVEADVACTIAQLSG